MTSLGILSLFALAHSACASAPPQHAASVNDTPAVATASHDAPPVVVPITHDGAIERDELLAMLDAGFGQFLSHVETEPFRDGERFVGFRIVHFFDGEARFANAGIAVGDTITHVNGRRIQRPDDALAAWNELRVASELVVSFLRDGSEREIRFPIVN